MTSVSSQCLTESVPNFPRWTCYCPKLSPSVMLVLSLITITRKGKKSCGAAMREEWGGEERNNSVDTKWRKRGRRSWLSRRFLSACGEGQKKAALPQPMGNHGGTDFHSAVRGEPMPQQCSSSGGGCSPQTAHGNGTGLLAFWGDPNPYSSSPLLPERGDRSREWSWAWKKKRGVGEALSNFISLCK